MASPALLCFDYITEYHLNAYYYILDVNSCHVRLVGLLVTGTDNRFVTTFMNADYCSRTYSILYFT